MAEKKSKKNQKYFVDAWLEDPLMAGCAKSQIVIHRPAAQYVTRRLNCPLVGTLRSQTTQKERNTKMLWRSKITFFKAAQAKQATGDNEKVVINDDRQSTMIFILAVTPAKKPK